MKLPVGGRVHQRLAWIAAQIHAGRIVDRGHAASASDRHLHSSRRRHMHKTLGNWPLAALLGRFLHAFDQRRSFRAFPVRLHVAVAICVEKPELERIHADQPREPVHLHLQREIGDRNSKTAHRRGRRAIGVNTIGVGPDVRYRVGAGIVCLRLSAHHRASGENRRRRRYRPFTLRATMRPSFITPSLMTIFSAARGEETASPPPGVDEADRPTRQLRPKDCDRLDRNINLAAEAAADRSADEVQLVPRHLQDDRRVVEREEIACVFV